MSLRPSRNRLLADEATRWIPEADCASAFSRRRLRFLVPVLLALLLLPPVATKGADQSQPHPAKLKISGYGFFGNLRLKRMIKLLVFQNQLPTSFNANVIEDSALILFSKLHDAGYLDPTLRVDITLEDGRKLTQTWTKAIEESLPRPLRARRVCFNIQEGVMYHYARIDFTGLKSIPVKHARAFFIETSGLIPLKKNRVYSPDRLSRSVSNLREALQQLGYQDARVIVAQRLRDDRTGKIEVNIRVEEGPKFLVRSVREEVWYGDAATPSGRSTNEMDHVYSRLWTQDYIQDVKTNFFWLGYPSVSVDLQTETRQTNDDEVRLDLLAEVKTGPRVRTGKIEFEGNKRTRDSVLSARVPLKPDEWLDRMKAEDGQYRLSRLGVFDSVVLSYQHVSTNRWNVVYDLKEGKRIDISLLLGVGSYDLLRGGFEVNQYDLWGLAHNQRLRFVQSFKSTSGDYTYTIPEVLGEDADVFFNGSGLRRKEISFTRVEYGGGGGVKKLFRGIDTDTSLRYNFGVLQATAPGINFAQVGAQNPTVGEFIGDARQDRRDNPLDPHRGYQLLGNFEIASPYLGGQADFQRVEIAASYHLPLNDSEWLHLRVRHGVVATLGGTSQDLPIARRFFPGGANSVRGYQEGEAAPRDADGKIIGAETYVSGTVEFEQALTPKWSAVAFVDGVNFARNLNHYPGDQALFSVGGGLSWRTLIGPVRVEYGYNLNPRPKDPMGTIQFSVGYPF